MEYKFTDKNFQAEVLEAGEPVMVDFYADWCGPCKMMAPLVKELAGQYEGRVKIGKLNIDENPETTSSYQVMSIPTFIFFKNGQKVNLIMGAVSRAEIDQALQQLLA